MLPKQYSQITSMRTAFLPQKRSQTQTNPSMAPICQIKSHLRPFVIWLQASFPTATALFPLTLQNEPIHSPLRSSRTHTPTFFFYFQTLFRLFTCLECSHPCPSPGLFKYYLSFKAKFNILSNVYQGQKYSLWLLYN